MLKKLSMLIPVVVLGGILVLGAGQDVAPEPETAGVEAPALPPPIDYRTAGGLLASILGGVGATWITKRKLRKQRKSVNLGLSALFTVIAGSGSMKMAGMTWRDSLITAAMGWGASQVPYQAHKHRNPGPIVG